MLTFDTVPGQAGGAGDAVHVPGLRRRPQRAARHRRPREGREPEGPPGVTGKAYSDARAGPRAHAARGRAIRLHRHVPVRRDGDLQAGRLEDRRVPGGARAPRPVRRAQDADRGRHRRRHRGSGRDGREAAPATSRPRPASPRRRSASPPRTRATPMRSSTSGRSSRVSASRRWRRARSPPSRRRSSGSRRPTRGRPADAAERVKAPPAARVAPLTEGDLAWVQSAAVAAQEDQASSGAHRTLAGMATRLVDEVRRLRTELKRKA